MDVKLLSDLIVQRIRQLQRKSDLYELDHSEAVELVKQAIIRGGEPKVGAALRIKPARNGEQYEVVDSLWSPDAPFVHFKGSLQDCLMYCNDGFYPNSRPLNAFR